SAASADRGSESKSQCPTCGRGLAIELLLREGLGRPAVAEEPPFLRVPGTAEALEAMRWSDMKALFASLFVDEIAAVRREGDDAHLRHRIRAFSREEQASTAGGAGGGCGLARRRRSARSPLGVSCRTAGTARSPPMLFRA